MPTEARGADLTPLAAEQRARQLVERALDRLARLQRVTAGLSEALTPREVAAVIIDQGIDALDARSGRISMVQPGGQTIEVLAASGYDTVGRVIPLDAPLPTNEVIRTGEPIYLSSFAEVRARFPAVGAVVDPVAPGALASAPLMVEGRVFGAMTLAFAGDHPFVEEDRELLIALATQCALALERARLYELSLQIQEDLRRSRDQLAAILGGIAEGVTVQDAEGSLVYANDVAARMSGYASPEEYIQSFPQLLDRFALFDEAGKPFAIDELPGRRLLRGETPHEVVVQFRNLETGGWHWSILDGTPVRDRQGRLQLAVTIFRDITARKRQADAADFLAAASTILGASLNVDSSLQQVADLAVPRIADWCILDLIEADGEPVRVGVGFADPDDAETARVLRGRRPGVNGGLVERVLRSGRGELVQGQALIDYMRDGDAARRRIFELMKLKSWIVVPLRARGQTFGSIALATSSHSGRQFSQLDFEIAEDLASRAALAIDGARLYREAQEQAQHQGMLNVALRETVEERDQALNDLHKALRTRDEFLTWASHDLKNPLASIKATAQLLQRRLERPEPLDTARLLADLQRVDLVATRATGLVEELLDLARMQMGQSLDLEPSRSDLIGLAREVTAEHQQGIESHVVQLESDESQLIGVWDTRRLGRALSNLLDNAVKYSPEGGPIFVRLRREGAWAVVEVTDAGIGIPAGDQARIFERFQRASNVEQRFGGTGIGLASVKHILDSHGGTISVRSEEGAGATFTLRLPIDD